MPQQERFLIIGGNRFFGRHLTGQLLKDGAHVTLVNRGQFKDGLGDAVERLVADRGDAQALEKAIDGRKFDAVIDQICFDAKEAREACQVFQNLTPLYVFTSSLSVYNDLGLAKDSYIESDYDPRTKVKSKEVTRFENYGEAKRQAEAVFLQQERFRVIAPRFTFVTGKDDPTRRLLFHVDRVKRGLPIYFPNLGAHFSFIDSSEAGSCLKMLARSSFEGPVNCSSPDSLTVREFITWVAKACGHKEILTDLESDDLHSPYGVGQDFVGSTGCLQSLGFRVRPLELWLPDLLANLVKS